VLDRKLLRDLFEMKGQALAIALVIAAGVAMFAMYLSNFDSLRRTQRAYYLTVAAFLLNIAMARALAVHRPQIAILKALGYTNREIAWHYTEWALVIASLGAALGTVAGAWLGAGRAPSSGRVSNGRSS
jgi:hypothetical protein